MGGEITYNHLYLLITQIKYNRVDNDGANNLIAIHYHVNKQFPFLLFGTLIHVTLDQLL
jgi:hypothetical protein